MSISALDYYRMKAEFLPSEYQSLAVYIRINDDVTLYVDDPTKWEFVGRTLHPSRMQINDVEQHGYCLRKLSADIDAGHLYNVNAA